MLAGHTLEMTHRPDIGAALRRVRLAAGFTQEQLAGALATTQPTVSRWEHADDPTVPTLDDVARIEAVLGLRRGELLIAAGCVEVDDIAAAIAADPDIDARDARIILDLVELSRNRDRRP